MEPIQKSLFAINSRRRLDRRLLKLYRYLLIRTAAAVAIAVAWALTFVFLTSFPAAATSMSVATPAPTPTAVPVFTYSGDLRAFYFGRTNGNACLTCSPKGDPDAVAFNFGGMLHGQLNIPKSGFSIGATYFGAFPFGANAAGPLDNIGYNPLVDNTLPGYALNLFGEAYVQYKSPGIFFQTGKERLSEEQSPWAHTSDSRIVPASFQGTVLSGNISPELTLGAAYIARFRSRVISAFNSNTLLTSCNTANPTGKGPIEGVSGTFTVPGDSCNKQQTTHGFVEISATYAQSRGGVTASAYQYQIYDLNTITYLDAQWNFSRSSKFDPFVGGQYVAESQLGKALIGSVHSHMYGFKLGAIVLPNLTFQASYDGSPFTTSIVASSACTGTASSPTAASPSVVFGGVANNLVRAPAGQVVCYGGGIASPYTDGYSTDTLYTTSITQGMAEVHKPGTGAKTALSWQSDNGRLQATASQAWYDYSLPGSSSGVGNGDSRAEFDFDIAYFFNPVVHNKTYQGFSIRQRYADRTEHFSPYEFKYSRTQLEYNF